MNQYRNYLLIAIMIVSASITVATVHSQTQRQVTLNVYVANTTCGIGLSNALVSLILPNGKISASATTNSIGYVSLGQVVMLTPLTILASADGYTSYFKQVFVPSWSSGAVTVTMLLYQINPAQCPNPTAH